MQKESLEKAKEVIISSLEITNIELYDKVELIVNLKTFLDNYDNDIKVLRRVKNDKNTKKLL